MVISVSLALIFLFGLKAKAEEKVGAPGSQSERISVADWIATQFHPYSTEFTIRAADDWSNLAHANLTVLSDVTGLSDSATDQGGSTEVNRTGLEFHAQGLTTQMTLRPDKYEARWRRSDLWLVPARKTEDVVVYKNVEFSGVFAHLTDLFHEPQKFLQLFNPWAPPGYGVVLTTRTGIVLWSFGF